MLSEKFVKFLTSFAYIGYLPASGTIASIFPALIYFFCRNNPLAYAFISLFFIVFAFTFCGKAEKVFKEKDSSCIVLDEIAGMFIVFLFLQFKWSYFIFGFILFRFFDILKVWPLKNIEKLNGATGVVLDDVIAGLYANIILHLVHITKLF